MSASDYITWRRWAYYNSDPVNNPRGDQPNYDKDQIYFAASGDPAALANVNKGWNNGTWDGSRVTDTDWADIVTQTGITHEHTISGSGGNETAQAFFSIGYLNNQGTQKGQEYERYNFSMSVDLQVNLGLKWADLSTVHGRFKTMVIPVPDNLQARALLIYIARQKLFHALVFLMMKKAISLPTLWLHHQCLYCD